MDWGAFIDRGAGASFGERSRRSDCDCVLVYLQRHVNSFIFGFHPVSRFRSEQGKEGVPHLGPLLHFLLIAGTYTPLSLVIIGGTVGWVLFGVIWAAAVVGIVFNAVNLKRFQRLSMVCYICMGWAVIFAAKPLAGSMPFWEMILLLAGGVFIR